MVSYTGRDWDENEYMRECKRSKVQMVWTCPEDRQLMYWTEDVEDRKRGSCQKRSMDVVKEDMLV